MNRPNIEDAAKEILRIAVRDMQVKGGDLIQATTVVAYFNNLPWRPADLRPALVFAQEKGWITVEGRLTPLGFSSAP
jgi:hypothetical protein